MKRRTFLKNSSQFGIGLSLLGLSACNEPTTPQEEEEEEIKELFFRMSLAQWSFHKAIRDNGTMPILNYAAKAKELGFEGVEYVSQLYDLGDMGRAATLKNLSKDLKQRSGDVGIENVLIMIDSEGDLAAADDAMRRDAVNNHKMWIEAAKFIGCPSVRVNLYGRDFMDDPVGWHSSSVQGLGALSEYAATIDMNVIVENHDGNSSHAGNLVRVIEEVNQPNCGTLPDFGNFCTKRDSGKLFEGNCLEEYDMYQGIAEMMPYAKGVSAKTYNFDEEGNETKIDFRKMLTIVKEAGFNGFIGVEYEGSEIGEEEGILATRDLLIKVGNEIG